MVKIKRIILGLFAVVAILLVGAALLVKVYVTPERVRSLVQSGLEQTLERRVTLGAIDVGLFSGIQMRELRIFEKKSEEALLSAQDIQLSYSFKSLLQGELQFGQIVIKEPQLRIVREVDGRLNIDDLLKQDSAQPGVTSPSTPSPASAPGPASAIPLLVKHFSLRGGTLVFLDRSLNAVSPYRYRLENLDISVENFSLRGIFPVQVRANLNGSSIAVDLSLSLEQGLQHLKLKGDQLDLVPFLPYLKGFLRNLRGGVCSSTELTIEKVQTDFVTKGQVVFDQVDIGLDLENPLHWNSVRDIAGLGFDLPHP